MEQIWSILATLLEILKIFGRINASESDKLEAPRPGCP